MQTLSTPTASAVFPLGTPDTSWTFIVTGVNADGSLYIDTFTSDAPSVQADLPVGATVSLTVTKNGISSLPSDPFLVVVQTVTLTVPDAAQKAVIA
jgi:hypothetical protein